jgi:hypothetical protein
MRSKLILLAGSLLCAIAAAQQVSDIVDASKSLSPSSRKQPAVPVKDGPSPKPVIKSRDELFLADRIAEQFMTYRREQGFPTLKRLNTADMHAVCSGNGNGDPDVEHLGKADIYGAESLYGFHSNMPADETIRIKKIASLPPHQQKLKIDDPHRFAVEVCTKPDGRYHVVVGFWYSKLGRLLDGIPRGSE